MEPSAPQATSERAVLSRELSLFLVDFSIALHKFSMYPTGHPLLAPAAAGVTRRLATLLAQRPKLHLGIARHQLLIEGVATDPNHSVMRELAGRLHRHHLGAVSFYQGVEVNEFVDVLRTLALEADRTGKPLGLGPVDRLPTWRHVRLHPLSYEILGLVHDPSAATPGDAAGKSRAAQLWVELARAVLAAEAADGSGTVDSTDPLIIARTVDARPHGEAYDRVIVGYLLQIAEELRTYGSGVAGLRHQVSRFVSAIRPETLGRLLTMGGDFERRRKFVLDATRGMEAEAVLKVTQATAEVSHQTVSPSLVRLLHKLSVQAEQGARPRRPQADAALRDQVQRLVVGWSQENPTPDEYGLALQRMSRTAPARESTATGPQAPEPVRLVQMSLEAETLGPPVWEAVWRMVEEGDFPALLDALEGAASGSQPAEAIWERIATTDIMAHLLAKEPVEFRLVDRLLPRIGLPAAGVLLDVLAASESRSTRRGVLDRLVRVGPDVGPVVVERLHDKRWFVLRNLLTVLEELPRWPPGFSAAPYSSHADPRVRRQAFKLQLKAPAERDQALCAALKDRDANLVRMALTVALERCPEAAVPLIVSRIADRQLASGLRVLGIRVLGGTRSPAALAALLRVTDGGRTWWGKRKLAPKSPELLAALSELVAGWSDDAHVQAVLGRALRSKDAELRTAATAGTGRP